MTELDRKKPSIHLELPAISGYSIVGSETYLKDKRKRPLSLSSIKDLRIVKQDKTVSKEEEHRTRLRSLVIASAALAKFKNHATMRRKEKRQTSTKSAPSTPNLIHANRLSKIDVEDIFDVQSCRRYVCVHVEPCV